MVSFNPIVAQALLIPTILITFSTISQSFLAPMPSKSFPVQNLVPKDETLASTLLHQNPEYDGRNIIVAILDTGVDPGAIGLQTTPTGQRKILDIVDATGSGDVDMSQTVLEDDITGLSGRKLKLNPEWNAKEYRIGIKSAYELYPAPLVSRIKQERKEQWDVQHCDARQSIQAKLKEWNEKHKKYLSLQDIDILEDLKAQDKYLADLKYDDVGPLLDCISYKDGDVWRGALSSNGDFTDKKSYADYSIEYEYGTLSERCQMNYALKFYEDGKTMCIVCDAGAHGSHVAGIVGAYHPSDVENNGVAPGAQIVSIKIGDSRLGSMETGVGLTRALISVLEHKCQVMNMSYGEFASVHNAGRFIELVREVVEEHGVVFVSSAGNEGPALSTVGAAGGTTDCILGVGAYISPAMQQSEYTMSQQTQPIAYTWSSRGPTFDGDFGVNVCAPGGAITCVPNWSLQKCRLMNGTSMSSPNCAGNIALLLSALKQNNVAYTPYSIRRALENTALKVEGVEPFAQGRGLIQVTDALDYLLKHNDGKITDPLRYEVTIPSRNARGIYLRQESETSNDMEVTAQVKPIFHKNAPNPAKFNYESRIQLKSTVPWISVGENLLLMHGGRTFGVSIHNSKLVAGKEYFGEVIGYDSENMDRKAIFRIPVTVIKPKAFEKSYSLVLEAGTIDRRFYTVPHHATWITVTISRKDENSSRLLVLHLLQMIPQVRQRNSSLEKVFRLEKDVRYSMSVVPGATIEICIAQYWSSMGCTDLEVHVDFRGVVPDKTELSLVDGYTRVMLTSMHTERIMPVAKLNSWMERIRPEEYVLEPTRDILPNQKQIYQLILTYKVTQSQEEDITPRFQLNGLFYESPYESQLCLIFNTNKRYIGCSDAYTQKIKLKKGEYIFRMQVRHDDLEKLSRLKNMILMLEHSIKDIPLVIYSDVIAACGNGEKAKPSVLVKGTYKAYFVSEPEYEKMPKGCKAGDVLQGTITYREKDMNGIDKPNGFVVKYNIPPEPKKEKSPEVAEVEDKRPHEEKTKDAIRDLLIDRLKKLEKDEFTTTFSDLIKTYPNHVPLLEAKLDVAKESEDILSSAQAIIDAIDKEMLILHFGLKVSKDPEAQQDHKEKSKLKESLINAHAKQLTALGKENRKDEFMELHKEFMKWVDDVSNYKYIHVVFYYCSFLELYGTALVKLNKFFETEQKDRVKVMSDEEYLEKVYDVLEKLEWDHVLDGLKQENILAYPSSYTPF